MKANGDRETAHFLRTFYVHTYVYIHTYMCRAVASIAALLSVSLSLFPLFLSLSNGFSNAYSAESWEYKCLLIVRQVLHRSEGVAGHYKEQNYIVEYKDLAKLQLLRNGTVYKWN